MIKHKHHIIPRHAGGSDNVSNLIELTITEHAEAHRILFEQYNRPEDKLAWQCLSGMLSKEEIIKEVCSLAGKKGGRKGGLKGKGKKQTSEWIEKRKVVGEKNGMYGKHHSLESNLKRSQFMKNLVLSKGDEFQGTKNLINSTKERMENGTHPSRFEWTCHCGKSGKGLSNYNRWHRDRCVKINS